MRRYFGAAAAAVFLMCAGLLVWQGGRDPFESPVASIPSLLVDWNPAENETEIFVHGFSDFRYTNISLQVFSETEHFERIRHDTYFMFYNTSMSYFLINITVINKNKVYRFNGSVQVADPGDAPTLLTLYEERKGGTSTHTLTSASLPWKKFMERVR